MTCSIKLVRLDDFIADIDSIDLSANGYALAEDGYFPTVAPIGARSVFETITLKLQGTSKDDLAAITQEINEKIKHVQWWIDAAGVERYQVWIRVQQENETYARQAMILNIVPPESVRLFTPEEINQNYIGEYQIGIERTPFWEDPYPYPTTTAMSNLAYIGGSAQLSETIYGDVPARLARVTLSGLGAAEPAGGWLGFKSTRFTNTPTNFTPVWPFDDALALIPMGETTIVADSTAYDGNKVVVDFSGTATLLNRTYHRLISFDVTNYADYRGTYVCLMRAKMTDTSIARARIYYGWNVSAKAPPIYRSRQTISGTDYQFFEMGVISFPPSLISTNENIGYSSIILEAELISGTGDLVLDCFILIPTEAMIKINSSDPGTVPGSIEIYQKADGSLYAYGKTIATSNIESLFTTQSINWGLPANGDRPVVYYCSNAAGNIKAFTIDIAYTYIPRWRTLRGNST